MVIPPPTPPDWQVPWAELRAQWPWIEAMHACPQDPEWHAEGDVGVHTEMVLRALVQLPGFRALPPDQRWIVWLAALLHDVAKPRVTRTDPDGRITSRGHSSAGAIQARGLLWRLGVPFDVREAVCALVRSHQVPFFLIDRDGARGQAIRLSQVLRCDHLALVALADALGRHAADKQRLIDNVELFSLLCEEHGCSSTPWTFASDHARVLCGVDPVRDPLAPALPEPEFTVTVMSGLPASGKDTWLRTHAPGLPQVCLDDLREEMDVDPADNQGRVVQAAREKAKGYLRARIPFAWNATNLSVRRRAPILGLCHAYGARVRIVCTEASPEELAARNQARASPVPKRVIERMIGRWEVPTPLEAHERVVAT